MKIMYWTDLYWPYVGGVEVFSTQLISALQKRGHDFNVITSRGPRHLPESEIHNGVQIYRFLFQGALQRRDLREIRTIQQRLARLKQEIQPDLIHLNPTSAAVFFHERTSAVVSAPVLLSSHAPLIFTSDRDSMLGRLLLSADWVSTVSQAMLHEIHCLIPEIASRTSIIYNGLELPAIEPSPLFADVPKILCLGRVVTEKGFDIAIDAFALVVKHFPTARLMIAGEGAAKPALEDQVAKLGMTASIEFIGLVEPERVPELINTSTMMVVPSRWNEPFGLVALQAAQMARPVIATRMGGLPEVVIDRQTGLLVEPENAAAIADAMIFLIENPATAVQLGNAARQRACDVFGWERVVDEYDTLYRRLAQMRQV